MDDITIGINVSENAAEAIDEIMTRYGQEILQLAFSYVKNKQIAEDLTQEIFVKCYRSLHTYSGKSKFRTWLWRIASNHCKDYLKSWYNKNVFTTDYQPIYDSIQSESVEQTVIQDEEDGQLASAVMELPVHYREVIYLFYFEEMSIKEIAVVTESKENTIKTRLKRAKELLKERLEEI
ncbi:MULTISPECIES: sigma-70 family RNA polymerase sigma factor [Mesobacillus]|uniref:sigma-70 family RNA polymerase sigma factor n=1 Tax=Mesobacillus TaxID=2675231 RepID=UPI00178365C0|nr:sigma-70 family RNA polymerase sigma factor [Mesobacillus jeotgali]MCM3572408.1 sigma-70 family RNA polymerase sigma factor [Mesobacillus subterraneus]UYZ23904.1 sigma-70 family RNA polymerase sigma factor [Mesobacillus jeotgali]